MTEDDMNTLHDIYEKLATINATLEALNRIMADPDPDPDDIAFLDAFANGTLDDEKPWMDDTWDMAMQLLPMQLIITHKS